MERSLEWMIRHTIHECDHHLKDVIELLAEP
jgi:hypothetical protein